MVDSFQDEGGLASMAPRPVRKKFAKPPVKVACLPCRTSRTRCGGQEPCANCVAKGRKCSYLPSKRGGPRKKKQKLSPSPEEDRQPSDDPYPDVPVTGFDERVVAAPRLPQVASMFQGYYTADGSSSHVQMDPMPSPLSNSTPCLVRTYGSEHEILNAYYVFIHTYFPILPPRASHPCRDQPLHCPVACPSPSSEPLLIYRPLSPLSLAISAILALIPHPDDPEPSSPASVLQRRTYAHTFAQLASSIIEAEADLELSSTDPSQALSTPRPSVNRQKLHPHTPEDLETLLTLLILSVYEYSQRGNLLKMRYRAGQALALALDKSLHCSLDDDEFSEARRRAWWMTYYCIIQGSIVSTTPPTIVINDPQFTTPYPRFDADAEGWSVLIQAQQVLVSATSFIADLNKCLSSQSGMHYMFERMQQLDAWTNSVLAQMDMLPIISQAPDFGDCRETITSQSIRMISRIKLNSAQIKTHRFRAFSDIPLFIKRHCDLTAANQANGVADVKAKHTVHGDGINNVSCSCGNLDAFQRASSAEYLTPSDSSSSSDIHPYAPQYPQYPFSSGFPYSSQHSAKVCLRAALVISRMFEGLPVPEPLLDGQQAHHRGRPLPRTMPSFACCLMQSSYAMFMIFYKARVAKQISPDSGNELTADPTDQLIDELSQGLQRIIAAVSNYSLAFEALDGMRDEIQGAYQTAFPSATI
ncbi:Transcription factor [Penicillium capsulatum]|uniref:Transcription factor n=1 Tax=Penicillium capsulatum TaxID=69766 RepID=A0A9W9HLI8_9EURO|nr:Transcription factor [Penicillium capsulatum]